MHLIHPALVHFAIAFLVAGGLLEAYGILGRRPGAERFGGALVVAGAISLVPTVATGFLAMNTVDLGPATEAAASLHERVGILVLGAFGGLMLWKGWNRGTIPEAQRAAYAVALLAAVSLVAYGAFLGGRLVYAFGVGAIGTAP